MRTLLSILTVLVTSSAALGCKSKIPEPEPVPAEPAALTADKPAEPPPTEAPPPPPKKGPSEDFIGYPKEGWTKVKLQDSAPLCVFSDVVEREKYKFVKDVKKQTLKADAPVTFGAFGPGCVSAACDDLPSLQCVVTREPGNTLHVVSRYIAYHKDGTTCTDDCREVMAGCDTEKLEAGKYTVAYGDKMYTLKIPSTLSSPCLKKE
jgi:hypothetical protein